MVGALGEGDADTVDNILISLVFSVAKLSTCLLSVLLKVARPTRYRSPAFPIVICVPYIVWYCQSNRPLQIYLCLKLRVFGDAALFHTITGQTQWCPSRT